MAYYQNAIAFFINHILPETQTINIISKTKSNPLPGYIYTFVYTNDLKHFPEANTIHIVGHTSLTPKNDVLPPRIQFLSVFIPFAQCFAGHKTSPVLTLTIIRCQLIVKCCTLTHIASVWSAIPVRD